MGIPLGAASLDFTIGLGEHLRDRPIQRLLKLSKPFLPFACQAGASQVKVGVSRGPSAVHARTRCFVLRQKPFEVRMHTETRIGNCKTEDIFQNAESLGFSTLMRHKQTADENPAEGHIGLHPSGGGAWRY